MKVVSFVFISVIFIICSLFVFASEKRIENMSKPQLKTSARLLKISEKIKFDFYAPNIKLINLYIYPNYLENAKDLSDFDLDDSLKWLSSNAREEYSLKVSDGYSHFEYTPKKTGNYMACWSVGKEKLYRYFSVIDDDYIVVSFSPFFPLAPEPTLHSTGIPLDYRLPADKWSPEDGLCQKFLKYNREFGDNVMPMLPDTPDMDDSQRKSIYSGIMQRSRELLSNEIDSRSVWLEVNHEKDPGYTQVLSELGVIDHCGLMCANARPWLGMPEFPFFSAFDDCRKADTTKSSQLVSHQWDFCGSWHFMGPVSWQYKVTENDFEYAKKSMNTGLAEFENMITYSKHPVFINPLYEALDVGIGYPNPDFDIGNVKNKMFHGEISNLQIFDRVLSSVEIGDISGKEPVKSDYVFDGKTAADSEKKIISDDFTVSLWVRPKDDQYKSATIFSDCQSTEQGFTGITLVQNEDDINSYCVKMACGSTWYSSKSISLKADTWQNVVVEKKEESVLIFVNGREVTVGMLDIPYSASQGSLVLGDFTGEPLNTAKYRDFKDFVLKYQKFIAFEITKKHKLVFARSVDVADYYIRHFNETPENIFSSITDDVEYDIWWTYQWDAARFYLVTREKLPWLTRVSKVPRIGFKDPLSYEFILIEGKDFSIRFEGNSPNPIWRFDYLDDNTRKQVEDRRTETPDIAIAKPHWKKEGNKYSLELIMRTDAYFNNYAIALWDMPEGFDQKRQINTNAKKYILVKTRKGKYHLILFFDLVPNYKLEIEYNL